MSLREDVNRGDRVEVPAHDAGSGAVGAYLRDHLVLELRVVDVSVVGGEAARVIQVGEEPLALSRHQLILHHLADDGGTTPPGGQRGNYAVWWTTWELHRGSANIAPPGGKNTNSTNDRQTRRRLAGKIRTKQTIGKHGAV